MLAANLHPTWVMPTGRQARSDRDTATARLLGAYHNQGDARARERLVELYMPLVEALARRHGRRGAEHDDLVQAGSIGLLNAIERFDPKRGEEFVAFAVPTVEGEMKRHIRDRAGPVRLPRRLHEASVRLPGARDELTARLNRAPTPTELAREVGVSTEDLAGLQGAAAGVADQAAPEDGRADELDASESRLLLAGAFQSLDDTDRQILYLRFVRELSRREVADELGFSQSALARRTNAALAKVRAELEGRRVQARAKPHPRARRPSEIRARRGAGCRVQGSRAHSGRLMLRMPQSLHTELARGRRARGGEPEPVHHQHAGCLDAVACGAARRPTRRRAGCPPRS